MNIHPTARIHPGAEIPQDACIGPYAVIGDGVRLGRRTRIGAHAVIHPHVSMGDDNHVFPFAAIGGDPQHLGYRGEETTLAIGNRNSFREFVTLHRGTVEGGGMTVVGDDCVFMSYAHVPHDCSIGRGVVMANAVQLGGHVTVGDHAFIGDLAAVHQHVRIGAHSMIGGVSAVAQDVPPYTLASGNRAVLHGLNLAGLRRHGFNSRTLSALKAAYRIIFRGGFTTKEAAEKVRAGGEAVPEVEHLLKFMETSQRGVCR